jgi:hypothetical protein
LGKWVTLDLSQSPIKPGIISFRDSDSETILLLVRLSDLIRLGQRRSGGGSTDDDM